MTFFHWFVLKWERSGRLKFAWLGFWRMHGIAFTMQWGDLALSETEDFNGLLACSYSTFGSF